MSSKAPILGQTKDGQGNDKLLDLYWNRAELKKAYAEAKDEKFRLNKYIDEHKGSIARLQQQLEHLEGLLIDPQWVFSVTVHYQLRALNRRCSNRLANFAEQLKQQREKRQHGKLMETWNSKRAGRAADVEASLTKLREQSKTYQQRASGEQARLDGMSFILRQFKKRSIQNQLDALHETTAALSAKEQELLQRLGELQQSQPPEHQGLDLSAKRSINFMIMAFAQQLYIQFGDDNLASLVKEAGDKSVGAIQYGDKSDCDRILSQIKARWNAFDNVSDYADELQQRARLLAKRAIYMQDEDVVPVAGSVGTLIAFTDGGAVNERNANLLGENYWGLANTLAR